TRSSRCQVQFVHIIKDVVGVAHQLPVHEVRGFHDRQSRTHVHRGAAHVVHVAHSNHRHVRHVGKDDRISSLRRAVLWKRGDSQRPAHKFTTIHTFAHTVVVAATQATPLISTNHATKQSFTTILS